MDSILHSEPLYETIVPPRMRPDLPCTDCGRPTWENLRLAFGCINPDCRRFGEMVPLPVGRAR